VNVSMQEVCQNDDGGELVNWLTGWLVGWLTD